MDSQLQRFISESYGTGLKIPISIFWVKKKLYLVLSYKTDVVKYSIFQTQGWRGLKGPSSKPTEGVHVCMWTAEVISLSPLGSQLWGCLLKNASMYMWLPRLTDIYYQWKSLRRVWQVFFFLFPTFSSLFSISCVVCEFLARGWRTLTPLTASSGRPVQDTFWI